jgi:hypothetical protein
LAVLLVLDHRMPGTRILYAGYVLKALSFIHLYWLFFRYHVLDDPHALSYGWSIFHGRRSVPHGSGTDAACETEIDKDGEPDAEEPVTGAGETDEAPEAG